MIITIGYDKLCGMNEQVYQRVGTMVELTSVRKGLPWKSAIVQGCLGLRVKAEKSITQNFKLAHDDNQHPCEACRRAGGLAGVVTRRIGEKDVTMNCRNLKESGDKLNTTIIFQNIDGTIPDSQEVATYLSQNPRLVGCA